MSPSHFRYNHFAAGNPLPAPSSKRCSPLWAPLQASLPFLNADKQANPSSTSGARNRPALVKTSGFGVKKPERKPTTSASAAAPLTNLAGDGFFSSCPKCFLFLHLRKENPHMRRPLTHIGLSKTLSCIVSTDGAYPMLKRLLQSTGFPLRTLRSQAPSSASISTNLFGNTDFSNEIHWGNKLKRLPPSCRKWDAIPDTLLSLFIISKTPKELFLICLLQIKQEKPKGGKLTSNSIVNSFGKFWRRAKVKWNSKIRGENATNPVVDLCLQTGVCILYDARHVA